MGQSGMSGLEGLLSQLSSGNGSGANGLDGLLGTLRQAGLGEQVDSWVNAGANRPVEPEALTQAFGAERLEGAAQGLGLQGGALAGILAQLLPVLIDRLTPQGQMPSAPQDGGEGNWGSILGGLLGGGQGGGALGGGLGSILGGLLGGAGGGQGGGGLGDILGGLLGGAGGGQLPQAPQDPGPAAAGPAATTGGDGDPFGALLRGINRGS
ncbi:YidB family protein [Plastoroseomonas hellenica]|uniref:YidB family protein n=1 Tax=Plastoroseomonas hellenica TaxID=2687306 RepID=UPI001BAAF0F8|nr:YidB family protein [Plastoroseomonas hellenica]MBR0643940.1 DUF937 domain-containing protein [Plastoroseomonas hellenica]